MPTRSPGWLIGAFARFGGLGLRVDRCTSAVSPALRMHDAADRTLAIWSFVVAEGLITAIHGVVNPDKLVHLQRSGHPDDQG